MTPSAAEDEDIMDDNGTLILVASGGGYDGDGVVVSPKTARIDSLAESVQLQRNCPRLGRIIRNRHGLRLAR